MQIEVDILVYSQTEVLFETALVLSNFWVNSMQVEMRIDIDILVCSDESVALIVYPNLWSPCCHPKHIRHMMFYITG